MLPPRALFAIGAAIIAGVFVASMLKSRGKTDAEIESEQALEKFGREQHKKQNDAECVDALGHAVSAAADYMTARYGEGSPDAIRELMVAACRRDQWSSEVLRCMDRVTSDNELQRCIGRLEDYQRSFLEAEMRAFSSKPFVPKIDAGVDAPDDGDDDVWGDPDLAPPPPPPPPSAPASDIPECAAYGALIEKMSQCDQLPQASRDALKQGYDAMKSSWSSTGGMSDDMKKTMADACRQATDALTQAGRSMCGW